MKKNEIIEFEMIIKSKEETRKVKFAAQNGWTGTPGTALQGTIDLGLKFLKLI